MYKTEKILTWKKGIFKETYEIFSNGLLAGVLKQNAWKQTAQGELNGLRLIFKTSGFFRQETQIIDSNTNLVIGKIIYNAWMTKATIEYNGKTANWKYNNFWGTKWSVSDSVGGEIKYYGSASKGTIESCCQDDLLVLTGLYITNYYWQISVMVIIFVFIPIFLNSRH